MPLEDDSTPWTSLHEFRGVNLTASYVLSWRYKDGSLKLDCDVCLTREHALYEPPRPSEKGYILPAVIEFPGCDRLVVDAQPGENTPVGKLAAGLRHGRISNLQRIADGVYRLEGAFGTVTIHAERPLLRLRANPD
jgi:hypothetical protein